MFNKKNVGISKDLYMDIEKYIQGTEFNTVSDFVEDYLSKHIKPKLEKKEVEERLRGLGYIE